MRLAAAGSESRTQQHLGTLSTPQQSPNTRSLNSRTSEFNCHRSLPTTSPLPRYTPNKHTMTIHPTHLAQRTRSCMSTSTKPKPSVREVLIAISGELERCACPGYQVLPRLVPRCEWDLLLEDGLIGLISAFRLGPRDREPLRP